MEVIVAKHVAFCFGVRRAVEAVHRQLVKGGPLYTLGPIIHNQWVVDDLAKQGVQVIESVEQAKGGTVIICSHGVAPQVADVFQTQGVAIIDATCPFVKRIHETVHRYWNDGWQIIIVGQRSHPEVIGINGWCDNQAVIIDRGSNDDPLKHMDKACMVAQTTITQEQWDQALEMVAPHVDQLQAFNTICLTTSKRQQEAIDIAGKVNMMLVVGGRNSSNTKKLYELCSKHCSRTFYIETLADLPLEQARSAASIGITAGASTPDWIIKEVITSMSDVENMGSDVCQSQQEEKEGCQCGQMESGCALQTEECLDAGQLPPEPKQDETPQAAQVDLETAQQLPSNLPAASEPTEQEQFMSDVEKSMVKIRPGQIITGTVVQLGNNEVCVNIGYKSDGIITASEFSADGIIPEDAVKLGDEIEVSILKVNDGDGNVLLSKKNVDQAKNWKVLNECFEHEQTVDGIGKKVIKGGLLANVMGLEAFIPASQVGLSYIANMEAYVGKPMRLRILEIDRNKRRIVASQKTVLEQETQQLKQEAWARLVPNTVVKGIVRRITDFGAFIELGGVDGLVHITNLTWGRLQHPSQVLEIGQEKDFLILSVDPEKGRVSLGYKQLQPKPWDLALEKYQEGSVLEGKVVRLAAFGAFVELEPGIDGLVHISQLSAERVNKVEDVVKVGQIIHAKVLSVDPKAKRISLSLREAQAEQAASQDEAGQETISQAEGATYSLGDMLSAAGVSLPQQETQAPAEETADEPAQSSGAEQTDEQESE